MSPYLNRPPRTLAQAIADIARARRIPLADAAALFGVTICV